MAPELVARGALRLWCRPARPAHRAVIPGGTPLRIGQMVGQVWGDGPTVVLVHGWGGHRGQLASLVGPLVAAGLRVVAYDAPSHGDSGPGDLGRRRTTLPEMMSALDRVVADQGPVRAVVGHSMGAAASALAVLDGTPVQRLVLVTPLADPSTYTVGFARTLGFGERTRHRFVARMEALAGRRLAELDVPVRAANADVPLPPTLVLSDRDDKEADHADGARIARAWPGAELVMSEGLGHRRILRDAETIKRIVAHVAQERHMSR
ncbi:alpha/beta fold hydrolase [Cellulomonas fengjieae]|uniref:Alpha/beta fold hydrolase n=2 Tax=Cellulomonas fengjieae TaxID=2819978 RepID=A0ABS3SKF4_9CELL|nr:alpha/beta fold hydrolase [Cellulomonas fengjieae]MBO3086231.1 alpha/beta fold hydrolase [Cellulomonas fengjieae]QVI65720.1 alpha/beta fold hydrolase [Cellulomonas fengjieae]